MSERGSEKSKRERRLGGKKKKTTPEHSFSSSFSFFSPTFLTQAKVVSTHAVAYMRVMGGVCIYASVKGWAMNDEGKEKEEKEEEENKRGEE